MKPSRALLILALAAFGCGDATSPSADQLVPGVYRYEARVPPGSSFRAPSGDAYPAGALLYAGRLHVRSIRDERSIVAVWDVGGYEDAPPVTTNWSTDAYVVWGRIPDPRLRIRVGEGAVRDLVHRIRPDLSVACCPSLECGRIALACSLTRIE